MALAVVALALLLFYGLPGFSRLASHAPADVGLFVMLLIASGKDFATRSDTARTLMAAGLGAWAATFEFLSGPLPMAMALLAMLDAVSPRGTLRRTALAEAALLAAFVAAFAAKQTLLSTLDAGAVAQSGAMLGRWLGAASPEVPTISRLDVVRMLRWELPDLYGAPQWAADAVLGLSVLGLGSVRRPALLLPIGIVAAWYAVLPAHAAVHVNVMVRLTVWLPATALAALALSRAPWPRDRQPAGRHTAR